MIDLLEPATVELVGAAVLPVIGALDEPASPRLVAARARAPLESLVARDVPAVLRLGARRALHAALRVQAGERAAYAELLRTTAKLLELAALPVPSELLEEART
jgi:hypothetical protein